MNREVATLLCVEVPEKIVHKIYAKVGLPLV